MINRAIRTLPFPLVSHYTLEVVRQIKLIPDENIEYTESEIAWMVRAIKNLEHMFAQAKCYGFTDSMKSIALRRVQIEEALAGCKLQQKNNTAHEPAD